MTDTSPYAHIDTPSPTLRALITDDKQFPHICPVHPVHGEDLSVDSLALPSFRSPCQVPTGKVTHLEKEPGGQAYAGIQESNPTQNGDVDVSKTSPAVDLEQPRPKEESNMIAIARSHHGEVVNVPGLRERVGSEEKDDVKSPNHVATISVQDSRATSDAENSHIGKLAGYISPEENVHDPNIIVEHRDHGEPPITQELGKTAVGQTDPLEVTAGSTSILNQIVTPVVGEHGTENTNEESLLCGEHRVDFTNEHDRAVYVNKEVEQVANSIPFTADLKSLDSDEGDTASGSETDEESPGNVNVDDMVHSANAEAEAGVTESESDLSSEKNSAMSDFDVDGGSVADGSSDDDDDDDDDDVDGESYYQLSPGEHAKRLMLEDAHSDNEDGGMNHARGKEKRAAVVKPNVVVTEDMEVKLLGVVMHIVEGHTALISSEATPGGQESALKEDTVLCLEDRRVIGRVDDVLCNPKSPYYTVEFNDMDDVVACGIAAGVKIFYPTKLTEFLFASDFRAEKPTDASNEEGEENGGVPEFSDDEKEREFYKLRVGKGRKSKGGRGSSGKHGLSSPDPLFRRTKPMIDAGGRVGKQNGNNPGSDDSHVDYTRLERPTNLIHHPIPPRPTFPRLSNSDNTGRGQSSRGYGDRGRGRGGRGDFGYGRGRGHGRGGRAGHSSAGNFPQSQAQPPRFQEDNTMHNPARMPNGVGYTAQNRYGPNDNNAWAPQPTVPTPSLLEQNQYWNGVSVPTANYSNEYQHQQPQPHVSTHYGAPIPSSFSIPNIQAVAYAATNAQNTAYPPVHGQTAQNTAYTPGHAQTVQNSPYTPGHAQTAQNTPYTTGQAPTAPMSNVQNAAYSPQPYASTHGQDPLYQAYSAQLYTSNHPNHAPSTYDPQSSAGYTQSYSAVYDPQYQYNNHRQNPNLPPRGRGQNPRDSSRPNGGGYRRSGSPTSGGAAQSSGGGVHR